MGTHNTILCLFIIGVVCMSCGAGLTMFVVKILPQMKQQSNTTLIILCLYIITMMVVLVGEIIHLKALFV